MFARFSGKPGAIIQRLTVVLAWGALVTAIALANPPHSIAQETSGPVVNITGGQVQGRFLPTPGGAVFKGMPYAAPPVGDFRWREPQPVKPWSAVLQTSEYGADCPQIPRNISWAASGAGTFSPGAGAPRGGRTQQDPDMSSENGSDSAKRPASEDCLFLNVWTPQWPSTGKKAVIVWLHGGELGGGTGALRSGPAEQAESSLARHGVVVVSIGYRGDLIGMIGHPELTAESPHHASGNYVLLDQIAALNWVHTNIARFGGDPGNVTVMGQSGGARATSMLIASPLTKGLIHRAIVESGAVLDSARPYTTLAQLEMMGIALAESLNAPSTGAIKYLRSLPASQIVAAMADVRKRLDTMDYEAYDEGIDGYAITQSPAEVYRAHKELPVPLMVGSTARDTTTINAADSLPRDATEAQRIAWVKNILQVFYGKYPDLLEQAMKAYGFNGTPNDVSTNPVYGNLQQQVGIDINHRCAAATTVLWHSAVAPSYQFEFTRSTPGHPPTHASELRFIFGFLSKDEVTDASALQLRDQMQQYWTNFAKTGDPNGPGLPAWAKYDAVTKPLMEFGNNGPVARTATRAMACAPYTEKFNRDPNLMASGAHQQIRPGGAP